MAGEVASGDHPRGLGGRGRTWLECLLLAAVVLAWYAPFLGEQLPAGDFSSDVMVGEAKADLTGSPLAPRTYRPFPTWDPLVFCGHPTLEFPSPFGFLRLPLLWLAPVLRMKALVVLFHVLGGLAMYALVRGLRAGSLAALFAGAVYPVMGPHVTRSAVQGHVHLPMFWALLPLVALALFRLRERDPRGLALLALALAALVRDTERTLLVAVMAGILLAGWLVFGLLRLVARGDEGPARRARTLLSLFLVAFAAAVAIEAYELVNGFLGDPYRGGWVGEEQARWIDTWSVDNLYSYIDRGAALATWLEPSVPDVHPSSSRYLGLSLFGIVLWAAVVRAVPDGQRSRFRAALLLLGLSIWLSFGSAPLVHKLVPRVVSFLATDEIGVGAKALLAGAVLLPLGLVVVAVARALPRSRHRAGLAVAMVIAAALVFAGAAPLPIVRKVVFFLRDFRNPDWFQIAAASFALALAAGLAVGGLAARAGGWRGGALAAALLALALADHFPYRVYLTSRVYSARTVADLELANGVIAADPGPFRVIGTERYGNLTDLGYVWHRKPLAWDFRAYLAPRRTLVFFTTYFSMVKHEERPDLLAPLLGLASVKYVVDEHSLPPNQPDDAPDLRLRYRGDPMRVYENLAWRPFVQAYPAAAVVAGELHSSGPMLAAALARRNTALLAAEGAPGRALLDGSLPVYVDAGDAAATKGLPEDAVRIDRASIPDVAARSFASEPRLTWTRPEPERILVHARSDEPLTLIVAESFHPWWRARVDGSEAPIHPAGFAFLGLRLAAGDHDVELRLERPRSFRRFGAVSLVALGAVLAVLWRTRSRTPAGEPLLPGD